MYGLYVHLPLLASASFTTVYLVSLSLFLSFALSLSLSPSLSLTRLQPMVVPPSYFPATHQARKMSTLNRNDLNPLPGAQLGKHGLLSVSLHGIRLRRTLSLCVASPLAHADGNPVGRHCLVLVGHLSPSHLYQECESERDNLKCYCSLCGLGKARASEQAVERESFESCKTPHHVYNKSRGLKLHHAHNNKSRKLLLPARSTWLAQQGQRERRSAHLQAHKREPGYSVIR